MFLNDISDNIDNKTTSAPTGITPLSNPENWVDAYGDYLYNIALLRLGDVQVAEDLVRPGTGFHQFGRGAVGYRLGRTKTEPSCVGRNCRVQ